MTKIQRNLDREGFVGVKKNLNRTNSLLHFVFQKLFHTFDELTTL
jgi:hypothetical protein